MHTITLREEPIDYAGTTLIYTASVEVVPYDNLPHEEYGYRTLADQIADGETVIEVRSILTGEVDSIAIAEIIAQVPEAATERYVVQTNSTAQVPPEASALLTEAEFHAERQRRELT